MKKIKKMFNEVRAFAYKYDVMYCAIIIEVFGCLMARLISEIIDNCHMENTKTLMELLLCTAIVFIVKSFYARREHFSKTYGSYEFIKVEKVESETNEE